MSVCLRRENCCSVSTCLRPSSELGGHCSACWRGLSPKKRATLVWEHENTREDRTETDMAELVAQAERFTASAQDSNA